jgi:hypothetical protein
MVEGSNMKRRKAGIYFKRNALEEDVPTKTTTITTQHTLNTSVSSVKVEREKRDGNAMVLGQNKSPCKQKNT